ncbi:hypothetical protein KKA17_03035 [bacterium]|nr:hypothetical protein [bacterium]MBU1884854.1 hypothetical protein [bacterium]
MFTNFKQKTATVFLDPSLKPLHVNGPVNVILSPSLYWFKKISLPVKSVRAMNKLLPSVFEDMLLEGNYSYSAYKNGEDFYAFAYDDKAIIKAIADKGISLADVAGVYFAQSELNQISKSVALDEDKALYVKDGIVILVPLYWTQESADLNLNALTLSKHKIVLKEYGHLVDNYNLSKIAAILLIFIFIVVGKYIITSQKIEETELQKAQLFSKYDLQPTMMQNRSILNSYKKIYEKQTALRENISKILSLKLQPTQRLSSLKLKDNLLRASFEVQNSADINTLIESLKREKIDFKTDVMDKTLLVKVSL